MGEEVSIALAIWSALKAFAARLSLCQIVCITLGCLLLLQTVRIEGLKLWPISYHGLKEQVTNARAATAKCQSDRLADRQAYAQAQAQAQAANRAQVQKVEQQYQKVTDDERQAYLSDRAKLIAYYDGLRKQAAPAAPGSSGSANAPHDKPSAGGTDGNGLQVPPTDDLQTKQDAAEIELRLLHLQQYVLGLLAVDPNK